MSKEWKRLCSFIILIVTVTFLIAPQPAQALTGNHEVIVAYYPIFPRWYTSAGCLWIGDPTLQYPLLSLYNNRSDIEVMHFDFRCMKNMGATVVNPHFFGTTVETTRCDLIDYASGNVGIKWTPTFESLGDDPIGMAHITNNFLRLYGDSPNLMRVDGRPVMFWHLASDDNTIAEAVELVRAYSGEVTIILDTFFIVPSWIDIGQVLKDPDNVTGYPRINGLYQWVSVFWCYNPSNSRKNDIDFYVNHCIANQMIPVLCTSPSYNEENWGYGNSLACGIGADRSGQPRYNTTRNVNEWESNLNDLLYNNHPDAWIYIQAWDEWAEGSSLAPTTYNCYDFLDTFKEVLYKHGWLTDGTEFCRPSYPSGYNPSECGATPVCNPPGLAPVICEVSPDPEQVTVETEYARQLYLCNSAYPIPTWSVVSGPTGLQVNSRGYVSGWTPSNGQVNMVQTITIRAENSMGYDDETWQVVINPVPDQTVVDFPFDSDDEGWTQEVWKAATLGSGTIAWDSASGHPGGNMKSTGNGVTNSDDSCTREGSIMTRAISTVRYTNIHIEYDVIASLATSPATGCGGNCGGNVLEGSCEDKLVVYYSTNGTGGRWTKAQELNEGDDLPTSWTRKIISLSSVTSAENNPDFALRFVWQFNTGAETGRIDNVRVSGVIPSEQVATPTITPNGANFAGSVVVSLGCATPGAIIRYTTNGSEPTVSSTLYITPFTLTSTTTIKARAFKSGYFGSDVASATFTKQGQVATPTITPNGAKFTGSVEVSLACATTGATIRYTTDGSEPAANSTLYSAPLTLTSTTTLKARAFRSFYTDSNVASATFTKQDQVATPTITPNGANFTGSVEVSLACATTGATIRYTTDGSEPAANSTLYSAPLTLTSTTTLKARAFKSGYVDSAVAGATFNRLDQVATPSISPGGMDFFGSVEVSLSCDTAGATIRYTINGTTPSQTNGTIISNDLSIMLTSTTTLQAIAYKSGMADSNVASATFTRLDQVATPTISPDGGNFTDSVEIVLSCDTPGATIRYTTDGTNPTKGSRRYRTPFTLNASTIVKAQAFKSDMVNSSVVKATFTKLGKRDKVATPTIAPNGGTFTDSVEVSLDCGTAGAEIRYTTDGSDPTNISTLYDTPFILSGSATVKARAFKEGSEASEIASAVFTLSDDGGSTGRWPCGVSMGEAMMVSLFGLTFMRVRRRRWAK